MGKILDITDPKIIISFYLALYAPIQYIYFFLYPERLPEGYSLLGYYSLIPLLSISLAILILITRKKKLSKLIHNNTKLHMRRIFFIYILACVAGVGLFWFYNFQFGYTSHQSILENLMLYRTTTDRGTGAFILVKQLSLNVLLFSHVLIGYAYICKLSASQKKHILIIVVSSIPAHYVAIMSGARFNSIIILIATLIMLAFHNGKRSSIGINKITAYIFMLGVMLFMTFLSFFRNNRELDQLDLSHAFYEFIRRFDSVIPNFRPVFDADIATRYGVSYLQTPLNFIPRSIFSDKPLTLQGELNDSFRIHENSGMDFGFFSEAWINFGVVSIIFVPVFYYLLYRFFKKLRKYLLNSKFKFSVFVAYCYLLPNSIILISSPINSTNFMFFVISFLFLYVTAKFLSPIMLK